MLTYESSSLLFELLLTMAVGGGLYSFIRRQRELSQLKKSKLEAAEE